MEGFLRDCAEDSATGIIHLGLITFGGVARLLTGGLVPVARCPLPALAPGGPRRLDLALHVLRTSFQRHLGPPANARWRDYRPFVIILLAGEPEDRAGRPSRDWQAAWWTVARGPDVRPMRILAARCAPGVEAATLQSMSTCPPIDLAAGTGLGQHLHLIDREDNLWDIAAGRDCT